MAIYSPRRSRWPMLLATAISALVIGVLIGALVAGSRPTDLTAAAKAIAAELSNSAGLLEVVEIEYGEAAASAFSGTELQAAIDNLSRSRQRYNAVRGAVAEIDGARAGRIDAGFSALEQLLAARADPAALHAAVESLRRELRPA